MAGELHQERLDTVVRHLLDRGASRVLDLGCGPGELLQRLAAHPQFSHIVGIDIDTEALAAARLALGLDRPDHACGVQLRYGSFEEADRELVGFDAATLVETIEHIDPRRLSKVEHAVFAGMRPSTVLVTTPNEEYNALHGMVPGQFRHRGHRFEWKRARFQQWARGVAARHGYAVSFSDIGPADPLRGSSTQMAQFIASPPLDCDTRMNRAGESGFASQVSAATGPPMTTDARVLPHWSKEQAERLWKKPTASAPQWVTLERNRLFER